MTPEQLLYEAKCLRAENAGLTSEANALRRETTQLRAELTEARKQPVALLPQLNGDQIREYEHMKPTDRIVAFADEAVWMNTVLARHFREAAEARVKPTLDVGAVIDDLWREFYGYYVTKPQFLCQIEEVIRRHVTDAPAPATDEQIRAGHFNGIDPGITFTAASSMTVNGNTITFGPDETLAAAVKRVERETRRECAAMVRKFALGWYSQSELADRMERGE